MKRIAICLTLSLMVGVFSPILPFLREEKTFTYASESHTLPLSRTEIQARSASLSETPKKTAFYSYTGTLSLSEAKGSFTIEIPLTPELRKRESDEFKVIWKTPAWESALREFDESETRDIRPSIWSEAAVFQPTTSISYEILSPLPLQNAPKLTAVDVHSFRTHLVVDPTPNSAEAASGLAIVSRASWGADETLRYQDGAAWKSYYEKLEKTKNDPVDAATLKAQQHQNDLEFYLASHYPGEYNSVDVSREENGHKLVWPIEHTSEVKKIVIHHTAENNLKNLSDAELLRATYYYHAVSRGWGDIGYNYVVGQRGTIYEGRTGWDYSVGAHASWNNRSTVWVSVIGNFEADHLNTDQEAGIKNIIQSLSLKYGIDLSKTSPSHKECKGDKANTCLFDDAMTSNLVGHRDVGYTSCPGANLYSKLDTFRSSATYSFGLAYKANPTSIQIAGSTTQPSSSTASGVVSTSKWPDIRILLSYKDQKSISIEWLTNAPQVTFGKVWGTLKKNIPLKLEASGSNLSLILGKKRYSVGKEAIFTSDILKVSSWNRKPTWDTSGTMNDNLFRGTLRIRANAGKIELVNILPIEDYLKGLAEISNGDPEEKVKTILVAARSYANFYSKIENRKFPGKDYDGSDDPDIFQKYLGYGYEKRSSRIVDLVKATKGIVVTYNDIAIKPWYFSSSDGHTRSYFEYCQSNKGKNCANIPYLTSVEDPGGVGQTRKGHGVGISGIGATYFANIGWKYDQILSYYLTGTKTKTIY